MHYEEHPFPASGHKSTMHTMPCLPMLYKTCKPLTRRRRSQNTNLCKTMAIHAVAKAVATLLLPWHPACTWPWSANRSFQLHVNDIEAIVIITDHASQCTPSKRNQQEGHAADIINATGSSSIAAEHKPQPESTWVNMLHTHDDWVLLPSKAFLTV